jgi:hypothetical protein
MGKLSRRKGAAFELKVAGWLNDLDLSVPQQKLEGITYLSPDWKRNLTETQLGNRGDVYDLMGIWPLVIQCKHTKRPNPMGALAEAKEAATTSNGSPHFGVAMIRKHGGEDMVCMTPTLFATFMKMAQTKVWPEDPRITFRDYFQLLKEADTANW